MKRSEWWLIAMLICMSHIHWSTAFVAVCMACYFTIITAFEDNNLCKEEEGQ